MGNGDEEIATREMEREKLSAGREAGERIRNTNRSNRECCGIERSMGGRKS